MGRWIPGLGGFCVVFFPPKNSNTNPIPVSLLDDPHNDGASQVGRGQCPCLACLWMPLFPLFSLSLLHRKNRRWFDIPQSLKWTPEIMIIFLPFLANQFTVRTGDSDTKASVQSVSLLLN